MNARVRHFPCGTHRAGFSLVEVSLAMGIAVFCLVVVFGLLNVGVNTSAESFEQTAATNVLSAVAADLRTAQNATPKGSASVATAVYQLTVPACVPASPSPAASPAVTRLPVAYLDADGRPVASTAQARYQLDVWTKPGVGREATLARVVISWPPRATVPAGSVETLIALDRN